MSIRHVVLGLLICLVAFFLALKNYELWTQPAEYLPEKTAPKRAAVKKESPPAPAGQGERAGIQSYIFIADKNIFHPDRKEFPIPPPPAPGPGSPGYAGSAADPSKEIRKPIVRPHIVLYGITLAGDYESAFLAELNRAHRKGEREIATVKKGDRIGEYRLARILPDRIGLEAPGDSFEVLLYDSKAPKRRTYARTENKPAGVVTAGPGGPEPSKALPPKLAAQRAALPAGEGIAESRLPRAVTPAAVPTPRRRERLPIGPSGTQQ